MPSPLKGRGADGIDGRLERGHAAWRVRHGADAGGNLHEPEGPDRQGRQVPEQGRGRVRRVPDLFLTASVYQRITDREFALRARGARPSGWTEAATAAGPPSRRRALTRMYPWSAGRSA